MISIAICDDEDYYRKLIKELILLYGLKHQIDFQIDLFSSGAELYELGMDLCKYQIMFLDITMEQSLEGIFAAKKIHSFHPDCYLVFITAFYDYVLEGYKVDAVRYILKDRRETLTVSLSESLDAIITKMKYQPRKITFSFIEGNKTILADRLVYIESQLHKLTFNLLENGMKKYTMYDKLDNIETQLIPYNFLRIHKSYLINMKYIEKLVNYKAYLLSGIVLPCPKRRFSEVRDIFIAYKGEF